MTGLGAIVGAGTGLGRLGGVQSDHDAFESDAAALYSDFADSAADVVDSVHGDGFALKIIRESERDSIDMAGFRCDTDAPDES